MRNLQHPGNTAVLNPSEPLELLARECPELAVEADEETLTAYGRDWTRFRDPAPSAVVFPRTTSDVQRLVRVAGEHGLALVPSGGRTGLAGGAVAARGEVVVSFDRMRRVVGFDPADRIVTVEAGVPVAAVQQFAAEQGLAYPVQFAADGSAQVGGSVATNAGGIRVLRHGMTRDWVAGLTAVDGTGAVLHCNAGLTKNATGYDFRHLLIGSEGTLALITEVMLRLTDPAPPSGVMLLGLSSLDALMAVFDAFRRRVALSAFEFFCPVSLEAVRAAHDLPAPLDEAAEFYALLEFDRRSEDDECAALEAFEAGLEAGWLTDGVLSQSEAQAAELWKYREGISEAITPATPYKNDLSVRIGRVPDFLRALDALIADEYPEMSVAWFGHIGDGNLHMNVLRPAHMSVAEFEEACQRVNPDVYALTREHGGSISAEHGIGLLKVSALTEARDAAEIERMRGVKAVFDPHGILNPGKLIP